jgi:Malectin domain
MLSAVYHQSPVRVPAVAGPRSAHVPWPVSSGVGLWVALVLLLFLALCALAAPIALEWDPVPNATGYTVCYGKASRSYAETIAIAGTSDDVLYQSERFGDFSYAIPVAHGDYLVTLKFKKERCR